MKIATALTAASISLGAFATEAMPVKWSFDIADPSFFGTASGSFVYDPDTNTVSEVSGGFISVILGSNATLTTGSFAEVANFEYAILWADAPASDVSIFFLETTESFSDPNASSFNAAAGVCLTYDPGRIGFPCASFDIASIPNVGASVSGMLVPTAVPLPASALLLFGGVLALGGLRGRTRNAD